PPIIRHPLKNDKAKIGFFDINSKEFHEIAETEIWCWQQGCRLQWFPNTSNLQVFYNCMITGDYASVIMDISNGHKICEFRKPLYSLSPDGKYGLTLNFSRLQRLRPGYGYSLLPDKTLGLNEPENDGIWLVNLKNGEEKLLHSIKEIANTDRTDEMENAEHYFNHLFFAPDSKRFIFFHLWHKNGKRRSRLIVSDISDGIPKVFDNYFNVSHYTWKNSSEILLTGTTADKKFEYRLLNIENGNIVKIGNNILNVDGHPTFLKSGTMILTDTYADKYGERHLLLFELNNQKINNIGYFYEPAKFAGEFRCDLHPRLSYDEKKVCIDFIYRGKRAIGIIDLP
ncbi:MAG: hypothetical protein QXH80_03770, partial [Candidatus Nanoarchaeia archaeon]